MRFTKRCGRLLSTNGLRFTISSCKGSTPCSRNADIRLLTISELAKSDDAGSQFDERVRGHKRPHLRQDGFLVSTPSGHYEAFIRLQTSFGCFFEREVVADRD